MKTFLTLAGSVLLATTLAACSPGINGIGHRITFDSSGMVVHAAGQPNAHVSRGGDLSIDGKAIATTPQQRQLLQQYYKQADGVMHSGAAMGKQGVQMAARGIGDAIASIFHGDASNADQRMNADSNHIEAEAGKLCANLKALGATQNDIAAQVPAFKPYAAGDRMQCKITHTVTIRDNGTITTSTTTSDSPATAGTSKP